MFSKESGRLGGTWSGTNAVDAAVGFKVIQIIERDGLLSKVTEMGAHLLKGLKKIESRYDPVRNARGIGLMRALTIDGQGRADLLMHEALKRGIKYGKSAP